MLKYERNKISKLGKKESGKRSKDFKYEWRIYREEIKIIKNLRE